MSDYTITTDFGAKDSLPSGNAAKIIKGSEFTTEFTNIKTAVNTKADTTGDTFTGAVTFDAAVTNNAAVTINSTATITGDLTVDTNTLFVDVSEDKVGIGTTSPESGLHVKNNTGVKVSDSDSTRHLKLTPALSDGTPSIVESTSANGLRLNASGTDASLQLYSNNEEAMRIDSSGRLLIGGTQVQTPSSIDNGIFIQSQTNNEVVGVNLYTNEASNNRRADFFLDDANGIYGMHSTASTGLPDFVVKSGTHERFRVTNAGNVGIGTTSPDTLLEVVGADPILTIRDTSTSGADSHATLRLAESGASDSLNLHYDISLDEGHLTFNYDNTGSNATERMRIDSSGNLLVGKTSTSSAFTTVGIDLRPEGRSFMTRSGGPALYLSRTTSDGNIAEFYKDGLTVGSIGTVVGQYLRIGSGDVGVMFQAGTDAIEPRTTADANRDNAISLGASSNRFKDLYLSQKVFSGNASNTAGNLFLHIDGNADGVSTGYKIRSGVGVTTGSSHIAFVNPNGIVGQIRTNGSATSYNTSSDQRLKENIQDADDAGSKIDAIQVRQFDWKIDGTHESYGVIAQELQSVAPEAVSGNPESEEMMGVDYSKLVPTLIKEIQTLRNRVAQLENN